MCIWTRTQKHLQSILAPETLRRPVMAGNKILQKVDLMKTVINGSQAVRLSAATVTKRSTRPAFAVQASKDGFTKAVQDTEKPLSNGTWEVVMK